MNSQRYYNARLKWELDENTRRAAEEAARAACHAEGLAEGKVQQVRMLQGLLDQQESDELELLKLPMAELDAMIATLKSQLRSRLP
jgi:hypothetical protein